MAISPGHRLHTDVAGEIIQICRQTREDIRKHQMDVGIQMLEIKLQLLQIKEVLALQNITGDERISAVRAEKKGMEGEKIRRTDRGEKRGNGREIAADGKDCEEEDDYDQGRDDEELTEARNDEERGDNMIELSKNDGMCNDKKENYIGKETEEERNPVEVIGNDKRIEEKQGLNGGKTEGVLEADEVDGRTSGVVAKRNARKGVESIGKDRETRRSCVEASGNRGKGGGDGEKVMAEGIGNGSSAVERISYNFDRRQC